MDEFRIGTRKSALAMIQTRMIGDRIAQAYPNIPVKIVPCITRGDVNLKSPLADFGGKGAFTAEIEQLLVEGRIDLAVHSAKDVPQEYDPSTEIISLLPREDPSEVLLTIRNSGQNLLNIGTSSPRRQMLVKQFFPEASCSLLRGNVPTRIARLRHGEYDGILLALAGIKRLGLDHEDDLDYRIFPPTEFVPAACQGIIAVQIPRDGIHSQLLRRLADETSQRQLLLEREILRTLEAGCHDAVGVYTQIRADKAHVTVLLERNLKCCRCDFSVDLEKLKDVPEIVRRKFGL